MVLFRSILHFYIHFALFREPNLSIPYCLPRSGVTFLQHYLQHNRFESTSDAAVPIGSSQITDENEPPAPDFDTVEDRRRLQNSSLEPRKRSRAYGEDPLGPFEHKVLYVLMSVISFEAL